MVPVGTVDPEGVLACVEVDVDDAEVAACEVDHGGRIDLAFY